MAGGVHLIIGADPESQHGSCLRNSRAGFRGRSTPLLGGTVDVDALLYVLAALVAGFVIGRYGAYRASTFQNRGEALLSRAVLPTIT